MKKLKISAVLVVKNEEKNLERCLASVKDLADEIIIVDEQSTDKSLEISKKFTDKIFTHKSSGFVEPARNFAIEKATADWILVLDADEEIGKSLANVLKKIASENESDYVLIPRKNLTFNSWIKNTGWWPDYQVRFFKKGKVKWQDKIHSVPQVFGKEKRMDPDEENAIIHHNYDSISQFISKLDSYTSVEAQQAGEAFKTENLIKKPADEFISRYFSHKGYKDGIHGLALSSLMAFYIFAVQLKLWEKSGFQEESQEGVLKAVQKETKNSNKLLRYWFLTAKINEAKNPLKRVLLKIKRRK